MQFAQLKRREFIALVGGATAWPFAARVQERVRRIGMISGISDEVAMRERLAAFLPTLQRLGWIEGRSVQIEYRWGKGNAETLRRDAMELAALRTGRHRRHRRRDYDVYASGYSYRANRICDRARSSRLRFRQKSVATGRERHRLHAVRVQPERQMVGVA